MTEKILYYLGAGASAQALPIARDVHRNGALLIPGLPRGLENARESFKAISNQMENSRGDLVRKFFSEFESLAYMGREFGNVDTYAKHLYLQGEGTALASLKSTLAFYFAITQLWRSSVNDKRAIDGRYLPWLISILERRMFPNNIRILSWNYDFQVQLAAMNFQQEAISCHNRITKHSPPLITYYPSLTPIPPKNDEICLIHLNGIAGLFETEERWRRHLYLSEYIENQELFVDAAVNFDLSEGIHFAWEKGDYHASLLEKANAMIADTTIVVVIGYSFPFFNREVDKAIFENLKSMKSFRKIYYQDLILDGQQLRAQFGLDNTIEIEHVTQVDNFHIPFEY